MVSVSITSASKSMIRFTTSGGQITLNVDYICPDGSTTPPSGDQNKQQLGALTPNP